MTEGGIVDDPSVSASWKGNDILEVRKE